ncbi:MAG: hydrogenase iron-sulfur subunit [Candidatus Thorarchaeota archaeon]|nr:MAG: methyl-viologen-reducing hydrogenase subunit delta [Candidatus Thorarchaeota archaeon]RLI59843.1 MAG: methyl-viologen-reducing hydrogenase subunit delta [Candidatus Thorarchaeota archaeon]
MTPKTTAPDKTRTKSRKKGFEPRIVAFCCNWCSYAGADLAGTSRMQMPPNVRIIRVNCTGRIDISFILDALYQGADGVLISGCHPGDCHYTSGNLKMRQRFVLLKRLLEESGIEPERVHLQWASAAEGDVFANGVTEMVERIRRLGPSPMNRGE